MKPNLSAKELALEHRWISGKSWTPSEEAIRHIQRFSKEPMTRSDARRIAEDIIYMNAFFGRTYTIE